MSKFDISETKLTKFARLPGLDGKKMGKSNNNFVLMSDDEEQIFNKVRTAITDPEKIRRNDPGHPEICNVFAFHKKFNPDEIKTIEEDCKSGKLGCVDCKKNCASKIANFFEPLREKRNYFENHLDEVHDVVMEGIKKAKTVAASTMQDVSKAMKMG